MATTVARSSRLCNCSAAAALMLPASVSFKGAVITSGIRRAAAAGMADSGAASVTSPAPEDIAAQAQSTPAPVIPREPATTSAWPCVFL